MPPLYHLGNARTDAQRQDMVDLEARGVCLFCPDHLGAEQRLLLQTEHWSVTPNEYPYAGTRLHLLLVPHAHVSDLLDLSDDARADLWTVLARVRAVHGLEFYGLGARNGDCRYTGGTIEHVHVHLVQGDVEDPDHVPVRLKLSSSAGTEA